VPAIANWTIRAGVTANPENGMNWGFDARAGGHTPDVSTQLGSGEEVETEFGGSVCVVRLRGALSEASATRIRRLVDRIVDAGSSSILIDASLLRAFNDDCAAAITALSQAVRRLGGTISAYGASGAAAALLSSLDG
jgi:anti-anti-sigma regulatory factor